MKKDLLIFIIVILVCVTNSLFAQNTQIETLVSKVSQSDLVGHVDSLAYAGGQRSRITFTDGNYLSADYIARYFESLPGISFVERDTFNIVVASSPYNTYPVINIVAQLDGTSENPKTFIVGGHYDASASRESSYETFWLIRSAQGADDNATGVAATMEIARILSDPDNNFKSEHNIRFVAFAAEEYHPKHSNYHHMGSLFDVQKINKAGLDVSGVLVLDMIAYNPNYDYIEIITNTASSWLADSVYVNGPRYVPDLITNSSPFPDVPYSDHQSYQEAGYSAILLMENDAPWNNDSPYYTANPHYHTTNDKIETINNQQLTKVTKLALATVAELNIDRSVSAIHNLIQFASNDQFQIYPNPFNSVTKIRFALPKTELIRVRVFDVLGREVNRLYDDNMSAGSHEIIWNGKNMSGADVSSGMYLIALETPQEIVSKKVFYVR